MVNDEIYEEFWISNISIFFKKKTIVLQNFLIKSGIYTIKQHKNFKNFLKPQIGKIEKKMSKILNN